MNFGHKDIKDNDHARAILADIERLGGKVTRLDFAIDYRGTLDYDALYDIHDTGRKPYPSLLKSVCGKTVYLGKRSSARMFRVYDKRAEIQAKSGVDIEFDITRLEMEIKRRMIARYRALFMSGKHDVILSDMQRLTALQGFCQQHKASSPIEARDKDGSVWAFIQRYKRIIGEAFSLDKGEFLRIIGAKQDGDSTHRTRAFEKNQDILNTELGDI